MKNKFKIFIMILFFVNCICSISFADKVDNQTDDNIDIKDYQVSDETTETTENYIDKQLEKININQLEKYMKDDDVFNQVDLKTFAKKLMQGKAQITDLINIENIKKAALSQISTTLKVLIMIIVLSLLSSILKSLENSFSNGSITKVVNYIIFITMVTLVLVNFKDVLQISYNTVNDIINIVNIIIPIIIALLAVGGMTITSTTLSPIFVGGVSIINLIFKNVIIGLASLGFCVLIVNNLSENIKLKKFASLLKKVNVVLMGFVFTIYLGLVSLQGIYITSFDKFAVKSVKFAVGSFIPVIGSFVSDSVEILLSSSLLIKNIFGVVGLVILVGVCLMPIIKIFSIVVIYKIAAALVEPIGQDNISSFMDETSKLMSVLLICVIAVLIMFFVTISILTSLSVVSG